IDGAGYTLFGNSSFGVQLDYRKNVTVQNLVIKDTYRCFHLMYGDNNTLVGNTIINAERAFYLWFSRGNNISANTISQAGYAFDFFQSPNLGSSGNVVAENNVTSSSIGISLMNSNNTFVNNIINSSTIGVSISGSQNLFRNNTITCSGLGIKDSNFNNDIDESNTINGKPLIYWRNQKDKTVPSYTGHVILYRCENITVKNLELTGVYVSASTGCLITGNIITNGDYGVQLNRSSGNTVSGNFVSGNNFGLHVHECEENLVVGNNFCNGTYYGVLLKNSNYNTLKQNNVENNGFGETPPYIPYETYTGDVFGVKILDSSNNLFVENNVIGNKQYGIRVLGYQHDNMIYRNNFIDNNVGDRLQVSMLGSSHNHLPNASIWDDGTNGNYWSDYQTRYPNASEITDSGIGDTPFYINENNIDNYPLLNPVEIEVVPEFPAWILLPLLLTATTTSIFYRKKLKPQT
ncbi:MAG: right-handed parallel beta-helix repeat-containing protein, partial [Candidatus Bathyarchaeota archaeon]|nr:right-handed parallel beta-helix repeat-containing protein [Candidatus Bathyarchaeota archaeon]